MRRFSFGLDLGHHEWKLTVLEENPHGDLIAFHQAVRNESIVRGEVVDERALLDQLDNLISNLSESLDHYPIRQIGVALSLPQFQVQPAKGYTFPQGAIEDDDIDKAIRMAKTSIAISNQEILLEHPKQYTLDNEQVVRDPRGMTAKRLDVEVIFVSAFKPLTEKLRSAFRELRLTPTILTPSIVLDGQIALTKREQEIGTILLDLGGTTTALAVHQGGTLQDLKVFPFGGQQLTEDLALHLRLSPEEAEELKKNLFRDDESAHRTKTRRSGKSGRTAPNRAALRRFLEKKFRDYGEEEGLQTYVKDLRKHRKLMSLVLVGGGAILPPVTEWCKALLNMPTKVAKSQVNILEERDDAPKFFASAAAAYAVSRHSGGAGLVGKVKGFFRNFIG